MVSVLDVSSVGKSLVYCASTFVVVAMKKKVISGLGAVTDQGAGMDTGVPTGSCLAWVCLNLPACP